MVKISFLCDNRCFEGGCETEHGFSCLLEVNNYKLLIDCGETDVFLRNAKLMNIDMDTVKNVLITHGHYDHGGGASHLCNKEIFVHKHTFQKRFKPPYKGHGLTEETLMVENKDKNKFIEIVNNTVINDNIYLLANIERKYDFEEPRPALLENGEPDDYIDEISVAVKTNKGLVVISGCAHRGICNTIEYAKKITGENRVHCVVGGFHLRDLNDAAKKTLEYFLNNPVDILLMAHCNGDDVIEHFKKELQIVKMAGTGMQINF